MAAQKKDSYHIADLIYKSAIKSLSKEEETELNAWLKEEKNLHLYRKIINKGNIENKQRIYSYIDADGSFKRLQHKIEATKIKKTQRKKRLNLYKYAALLLLLLSSGFMLYLQHVKNTNQEQKIATNIKPGYSKATLVMGNGKTISLGGNTNKVIARDAQASIKTEGDKLTYTSKTGKRDGAQKNNKIELNTLIVPLGGIYQVDLADGTKVWLNSKSSLKYPVHFTKDQRVVELEGEAYFEVSKTGKKFMVKTKAADITVLGTKFNVSAYKDDAYFASTLDEGSIKLSAKSNSSPPVLLHPGEQGRVVNSKIKISGVDTSIYSAWKKGVFYFENESLKNILKEMSRWYSIKVSFKNRALKTKTFTGVASKNMPIENLLDLISKSTNVDYKILKKKEGQLVELVILNK